LRAAQARGGAREDDGAALPRHHDLRRLAPHQEAAEAGHLPDLEEHPRGGLADREADIGADVIDRDLDLADVALDLLEQRRDLLFLPRVVAEAARLAAFGFDVPDERLQLVGMPPGHAGYIAFLGKTPGNGAAGGVARADDQRNFVGHACPRLS
jgi:hypothetical protein